MKVTLAELAPRAAGSDRLWQCAVVGCAVDEQRCALSVRLQSDCLLSDEILAEASRAICAAYSLERAELVPGYALRELGHDVLEYLRTQLMVKYPSLALAFENAVLSADGCILQLEIESDWHFRVEALHTELEAAVRQMTGLPVRMDIRAVAGDQGYEQRKEAELRRISEEWSRSASAAPQRVPDKPRPRTFERKKTASAEKFTPPQSDENIIYGRPVSRTQIPLSEVAVDTGKTTVSGTIFYKDIRKLGGKGKTVVTVDIYDGTGSLRVTKVLPDDEAAPLDKALKKGMSIVVQGVASYNQFEKDVILTPSCILKGEKKVRTDNAPQKRVELHLHTNMSSMDAIGDAGAALGLAASMGHPAMAITDHGVAQAYPDAMKAAKALKKEGKEIKVLYGVEAYCTDDTMKGGAVKGYTDAALDDEIIVFDLETTGLKPSECEIIEVAAVLVQGGEIRERFHTHVKPCGVISAEITSLTGITNEMVQDAPPVEEVLPRFLDFCGDRPLCAHNADFDVSFIRAACEKMGIERSFCSIDTVELSRVLLPELKKHRLNVVAEHFGFTFEHHRADEDTEVLAKIYFRLCEKLEQHGVHKVSEINDTLAAIREGGGVRQKRERTWHTIVLVRNMAGLRTLYELISLAHLRHYKKVPIIPLSLLLENRENLIIGSACEAGQLFSAVVEGKPWGDLVKLARRFDFLEIQPIGNNRFMLQNGMARDEEQLRDFNRTILKLGDSLGIPVCATGDVHFLEPGDAIFREILMAGKGFEDASNQPPLYFKTTDEMLAEFSYLGTDRAFEVVVTNTNKIAALCDEIQPVPDGTYPPSVENSAQEIEGMSRRRAAELYEFNGKLPQIVADRLEQELGSIIKHGFDVMYIIAQKLVAKSLAAGYLVGSRGSVGSSFVAYLTGITEVNALLPHYRCPSCRYSEFYDGVEYACGVDMPDKNCPHCGAKMVKDGFNIPFATFLGFEGDKAPDIDLNFSGEYQLQAHRDTIELFGEGNVYKAGTIGTVKEKTAYGFVKKYLEERGKAAGNAEVNRLVQGCTGIKRTTGQHPGGLIVVPQGRSIYEFCPVQHPADDPNSDIITTHFDYHSIHDNLLKLDLLGHDDPTMIRKLHDLSGFDPRQVPLDDPETMKLFTSLEPLGIEGDDILGHFSGAAAIPEFGTKFVRGMLEDTKPTTFDELLRISGLSHGTDVWLNNAKDVVTSGLGTLKDVICVRDDITIKLMQMGLAPKLSFTISESVRKGKGLKPEWEEEMRAHGLPEWYIGSCKKIQYMFPRAHAVAYVMMAYRIAWFKVHRPMEFYSAYFSIRAGAFDAELMTRGDAAVVDKYHALRRQDKRSAVEEDMLITLEICHEFYKRGFTFAPLDVYHSDVSGFTIDGKTLIPPLTSLPGVGESAAQSIVDERQKGPFMSMEDMILRCDKCSRAVAETLERVGALGGLPKSNQLDLFEAMGL